MTPYNSTWKYIYSRLSMAITIGLGAFIITSAVLLLGVFSIYAVLVLIKIYGLYGTLLIGIPLTVAGISTLSVFLYLLL